MKAVPWSQLEMFKNKKKGFFLIMIKKVGLLYYCFLKCGKNERNKPHCPEGIHTGDEGEIISEELFPVFQESLETSDTDCPVTQLDFVKGHQHVTSHSTFQPFTDLGTINEK